MSEKTSPATSIFILALVASLIISLFAFSHKITFLESIGLFFSLIFFVLIIKEAIPSQNTEKKYEPESKEVFISGARKSSPYRLWRYNYLH